MERSMAEERRERGTWVGAAVLILGVTAVFIVIGIDQARQALDPSLVDRETYLASIGVGLNPEEAQNFTGLTAIVVLGLCLLTTIEAVGVLARRQGPRHAAIGTFVVFAAVTLPLAVAGLFAENPNRSVLAGLLIGLADALVVYLLLHQRTVLAFDRADKAREREHAARQAARDARRAQRAQRTS
jgi:hypothetical protein